MVATSRAFGRPEQASLRRDFRKVVESTVGDVYNQDTADLDRYVID